MAAKLTGAVLVGATAFLLAISRHAMPIAARLQLTRGVSLQDMAFVSGLFGLVSFGLLFVVPFVVGYSLGARVDFASEYPSVAGAIGFGGGLGYLVGTAVIVPTTTVTPGVITTALLLIATAIAVAIEVTIVGFAGGALAYLRTATPRGAGVLP